jgi:hypothetical protein
VLAVHNSAAAVELRLTFARDMNETRRRFSLLGNKVYKSTHTHIQLCKAKSCDAAERWAQINTKSSGSDTVVANKSRAPNFTGQVLVQKV